MNKKGNMYMIIGIILLVMSMLFVVVYATSPGSKTITVNAGKGIFPINDYNKIECSIELTNRVQSGEDVFLSYYLCQKVGTCTFLSKPLLSAFQDETGTIKLQMGNEVKLKKYSIPGALLFWEDNKKTYNLEICTSELSGNIKILNNDMVQLDYKEIEVQ